MDNSAFIPTRSVAGLAAQDVFYRPFNDVNFYVEDADQENLYCTILKKHFPELKIEKVFPLGGKENVLAHLRDPVNQGVGVQVYLVDKDFDDLLNTVDKTENLFYLEKYCIENYLLEIDALIEVIVETFPKKKRAEIEAKLNFEAALGEMKKDLFFLFTMFFCVQYFEIALKNCSSKPEEFCKKDRLWKVNIEVLNEYWLSLLALLDEKGVNPPLHNPFVDSRVSHIWGTDEEAVISGKFLLAMVFHYVKSHYKMGSITFDSFVYRIAKNSSFSSLSGLAQRVTQYLAKSGVYPSKT